MNIVMIHYHLGWGGVTRVVAAHVRALAENGSDVRVAVVHGGGCEGWPADAVDTALCEVDGLGYDAGRPRPAELAENLRRALGELGFAPAETVVHVHNHALGKSTSLPGALHELAGDGYALLLHAHDFAEDFRAEGYRRLADALAGGDPDALGRLLYASARHVHHAVLNRRDEGLLRRAGVPAERVHLLPNPVPGGDVLPPREEARTKLLARRGVPRDVPFLVYPVRGIRRKNVGELLLLSLLLGGGTHVALTLAPQNPVERRGHDRWRDLAGKLALPCLFGLGDDLTLAEALGASDRVVTTSVAEGFGLVFLEPWLAGRGLLGRDLPEITSDFKADGLDLSGLEERLDVPVEWIGEERFARALESAYLDVLRAYGRPARELAEGRREHLRDGFVDFASLTSALQAEVLERASRDPGRRRELRSVNPWIERAFTADGEEVIRHNAEVVREAYSLTICGERLRRIYGRLAAAPRGEMEPAEDGSAVLDGFLDLKRFHPLRVER